MFEILCRRFDQCSISPLSLKGVKAAGYEKMTVVQEATLPVILRGLFLTFGDEVILKH